jgi:hypothetical protein
MVATFPTVDMEVSSSWLDPMGASEEVGADVVLAGKMHLGVGSMQGRHLEETAMYNMPVGVCTALENGLTTTSHKSMEASSAG